MTALPNDGMPPTANHVGCHRDLAANHGSSRRVMPGVKRLYWAVWLLMARRMIK